MSLEDFVRKAWREHREVTLLLADRLVAHAATLNAAVPPTPQEVRIAREAAHRLAGSLGMYGLSEGSDEASNLEIHLAAPGRHPLSNEEFRAIAIRLRWLIEVGPPDADPSGGDDSDNTRAKS